MGEKMLKIAFVAALLFVCSSVLADKRCPAGDSGCTMDNVWDKEREIVNGGATDFFTDEETFQHDNKSAVGRAKRAGGIARDCVQCATDAVKDGFDRINGKGVK